MAQTWNANLYDARHGFVSTLASDLIDVLAPGDLVLDLGCGTGTLASEISRRGAIVRGLDASSNMVEQARAKFPDLQFDVGDATTFELPERVDAIFSNAVLHWVRPPEKAIAQIAKALKPRGRLVAEFGGHGNVRHVLAAASEAARSLGVDASAALDVNYFPTIPEYTRLLDLGGFKLVSAKLFDRPTRLDDGEAGLTTWYRMFRGGLFDVVPPHLHTELLNRIADLARPTLWHDNAWHADYRRLRIVARLK